MTGNNKKMDGLMSQKRPGKARIKGSQILAIFLASLLFLCMSGLAVPSITMVSKTVYVDGVDSTVAGTLAKEGSVLDFVYVVRNNGDTPLTSVAVEDTRNYPAAGTLVTVSWTGTTLAVDDTATITDTYTVGGGGYKVTHADVCRLAVGGLDNTAVAVGYAGVTKYTSGNSRRVQISLDTNANIHLEKSSSATSNLEYVGRPVTYDYVVQNTGALTLTNVQVTDTPLGLVPAIPESLAPGQTKTYHITQNAPAQDTFYNFARVTSDSCLGGHPSGDDSLTIKMLDPSISIVKTGSPTSGAYGDTLIFYLQVDNTGSNIYSNNKLHNVVVTDVLPKGLTFDSILSDPAPTDTPVLNPDGTTTVTYDIGDLYPDDVVPPFTLAATVNHDYVGSTTNNADVDSLDAKNAVVDDSDDEPVTILGLDFTFQNLCDRNVRFEATTPSGGTAPYQFSWNFGPGETNPGDVQTTTHQFTTPGDKNVVLTVTDSLGHSGTVTYVVNVPPSLTASAGSNKLIIKGGSVQIGGAPTSSGGVLPHSYSWDPAATLTGPLTANPTASPTATQTYTVNVLDSIRSPDKPDQCPATSTVTMQVSVIDFTITNKCDQKVEFSGITPLLADPVEFTWEFGDGTSSGPGSDRTIEHQYATPGSYDVKMTVTDANGVTGSVTKTVADVPASLTASAGSNKLIIKGGSVQIGGAPTSSGGVLPHSYSWTRPPL